MIKRTAIIVMLAITAPGFIGIATAQDHSGTTPQLSAQERALLQKLRQKQRQLQQIQAATFNANPELRHQAHQFLKIKRQAIEAQGYDIEATREHVKRLTEKLKRGGLNKEQRKTVLQALLAERRAFEKARAAAIQQPKVQKAAAKLAQATRAAMKAQSDKTEALLQAEQRLREQLRQLNKQSSSGS